MIKKKNQIRKPLRRCPKFLKDKYREWVKYICESCNKEENEVGKLQIHRIKRGMDYYPENVKVVCRSCHKKYHANEFKGVKSK